MNLRGEIPMRKVVCFVGLLLLVSLSAAAQDKSRGELFGGYSYLRFSPGQGAQSVNFNGGVGSVSANLNNWFAVVGEIGGYHNGSIYGSGVHGDVVSYLFGPRIFMSRGKITVFGQGLFGGAHAKASGGGLVAKTNAFATAIGGGLDWNVGEHFGVRLGELDYVMTRFSNSSGFGNNVNNNQNSFRYSTGVVFRF
jgi:hypothetical protein